MKIIIIKKKQHTHTAAAEWTNKRQVRKNCNGCTEINFKSIRQSNNSFHFSVDPKQSICRTLQYLHDYRVFFSFSSVYPLSLLDFSIISQSCFNIIFYFFFVEHNIKIIYSRIVYIFILIGTCNLYLGYVALNMCVSDI